MLKLFDFILKFLSYPRVSTDMYLIHSEVDILSINNHIFFFVFSEDFDYFRDGFHFLQLKKESHHLSDFNDLFIGWGLVQFHDNRLEVILLWVLNIDRLDC